MLRARARGRACGCGAGAEAVPDDAGELRETVRDRYARAAEAASTGEARVAATRR